MKSDVPSRRVNLEIVSQDWTLELNTSVWEVLLTFRRTSERVSVPTVLARLGSGAFGTSYQRSVCLVLGRAVCIDVAVWSRK
jgi:hypothetical protein